MKKGFIGRIFSLIIAIVAAGFLFSPSEALAASFPTHFRVANDQASLASATEQVFDSNGKIIDWKLSDGAGEKTVYAQFKVDGAWQTAISTTVNYTSSTEPSLSVDKTNIAVNESVTVSWTGSKAALDWVGLYPTSTPAGSSQGYVDWKYTGNCTKDKNTTDIKASGSCPFILPANASGSYEFRMFANNSSTYLVSSPTITVTGVALSFGVPKGSTMAASWHGSQSALDWIGLYSSSTSPGAAGYLDWKYTGNCTRDKNTTNIVASGFCNFTMPNTVGSYEFRMFTNNTNTQITTSPPLTVTP